MNTAKLFVSFWHICLDNLPEGSFTRRRVTPADARLFIEQARAANTLLCLSDDDLLAPYHQRDRDDHDAFCRVLHEHFGITLSFRDFCGKVADDDDDLYSINPLSLVQVQGQDRLLVVTCAYMFADTSPDPLDALIIDPTTVAFHMFAAD